MKYFKLLFLLFVLMCTSFSFSQSISILPDTAPEIAFFDGDYELGVKFTSSKTFKITHIRYYKTIGEAGTHTGKIWNSAGDKLIEVEFLNEVTPSEEGWQYAAISPALYLPAGEYTVSVNSHTNYGFKSGGLLTPIVNGFLSTTSGGLFNENPGSLPTQTYNNSNYYRDIVAEQVYSLFPTQTPTRVFTDVVYELGVKFKSTTLAKVSAIKFYKDESETGNHTGNLWTSTGTLLATINFVNETASGWQTAFLSTPVYIQPNTTYVVSVNSNTSYAVSDANALDSTVTNGIISTIAGNNGVFSTPGVFPVESFKNTNYFRDVVVEAVVPPAVPQLTLPSNNYLNASIEQKLQWKKSLGATSYTLEVATDAAFVNKIKTVNVTSESYTLSGLKNETKYYWRVRAELDQAPSTFSSAFNFTTIKEYKATLSYPIGGTNTFMAPIQLSWYLLTGGTGFVFDIYYSTDAALTNPGVISGVTYNYCTLGGLQPGVKYYWKVRTRTAAGVISAYSAVDSFISFGSALVPVPSYPIAGEIIYNYSPTLYWYLNGASVNLKYEVEIREGGSAALTGTPTHTNITSTNLPLLNLGKGKTYTWWVRSVSGAGVSSAWSAPVSFSTIQGAQPLKPVITYPVNNPKVYSTSQNLFWYVNGISNGLTFEVQYVVGLNTDFTNPVSVDTIKNFSYLLKDLLPNTTYKWRVRSKDGVNPPSAWSEVGIFTTVGTTITAVVPVPSYPVNNPTVYASSTNLYWYINTVGTGLTYEVSYGTTLDDVPEVIGLTEMTLKITGLQSGKKYFWKVRTNNGTTTSAWSSIASFTTKEDAPTMAVVPVPAWPIGGAIVYTTSQELTWYVNSYSAGLKYDLQYGTNPASLTTVTGITATKYTLTNLTPGVVYYWKVRSDDGTVQSGYSTLASFKTNAGTAAAVPVVGSPVNGEILSEAPVLSWFLPVESEVVSYQIEYSTNADMLNSVKIDNANTEKTLEGLEKGTYYWRVRSKKADGFGSAYSNTGTFTINSPLSVNAEGQLPSAFELSQNYPNPFNPSTTIKFGLKADGKFALSIYNILGQEVTRLFDEYKDAGYYSVNFNASHLASGIYFYRLTGPGVNLSKRMVLVK